MNTLKNSKSILLLALLSIGLSSNAQEESKTKIKGFADGYYKFDSGRINGNNKSAFTEAHNSYEISSVNLQAEHSFGKAKFYTDLGLGRKINNINENDGISSARIIKELYASFELTSNIKATFGIFERTFGIERVNSIENNNFSASYLFSISPKYNTGVKFDLKASNFNFIVGASNFSDYKSVVNSNIDNRKTIFAKAGYKANNTDLSLNFQASRLLFLQKNINQNNYYVVNLTGKQKINDKFDIALDANYVTYTFDNIANKVDKSESLIAVAAYAGYNVNEKLRLSYRLEYFDDKNKLSDLNLMGGNVISNTLTGIYKIGKLNIVPELRFDSSNKENFRYDGSKMKKFAASYLIAAVYNF